jgi:hypothetical protein
MSERDARVAKNETVFREVNERVRDLTDFKEQIEFLCECGDGTCLDPVTMSVEEYERVRAESTWFLIVPGHAVPDVETVLEEHEGFQVVEKRDGVPAAIAIDADPRD